MNNDHRPVAVHADRADVACRRAGGPAAEALLEAEAGGVTAPWEWQGRSAGTAEIHLTEEAGRQSDAEVWWGGRGPSASCAEGQPEAGS